MIHHLGESKIGENGFELGIKKDVIALDVSVKNGGKAIVVKISKTLSGSNGDLVTRFPVQASVPLKQLLEIPVGEVVVQKQLH